ncbi:minor capsid protein [Ruminococcus sp.]|uniref:minor capsid protein n=1 Tax=Ruminococcus sp. TaxID=41978 RepID=UPI002E77CC84|nr:minor capsid protein [Ruminococcus sp.]MEE1396781.1 minor capsid protein [Ruminococcus sp.]
MPGKSSPVYWHDRKVQYDESLGKDEKRLYSKLAAYYDREAARLGKEIAAYYTRYSVNGVLSYRNLLETLPDADKRLLIEQLDEFVQKYPEYADLVPVRESIYQLNRLEGLRQSIAMQQLEMGAYEQAQALAFFQRQALRYANGAASFLGLGSSFYRLDSALIRTAVGNKWCDGKDFSERIWDNRTKLGNTLHTQFVNGVIRGEDYHQLARQIREKFTQVSQKNAERLTFTEDTYLSNEAAMLAFAQEASYTEYEFVCTGDAESCDICKSLSGERFKIAERTPGANFPPMHPWCRCFFTPVVPSLEALREGKPKEAASREKQDAILLTDWVSSDIIGVTEDAIGNKIYVVNRVVVVNGPPNGITQKINDKGGVDRNYYDSNGCQIKQISNNDHGHKKERGLGKHGEHKHIYIKNEKGIPMHGEAVELSELERKENADIL